jgi:hypothetical protein
VPTSDELSGCFVVVNVDSPSFAKHFRVYDSPTGRPGSLIQRSAEKTPDHIGIGNYGTAAGTCQRMDLSAVYDAPHRR